MKNVHIFSCRWFCSVAIAGVLVGCVPQRTSESAEKTKGPKAEEATSTQTPQETVPQDYLEASLESLFSRVLSRGFKKVSPRNNISATRCRDAMRALTARGNTSARFLEKKLSAGTLAEKSLAMWLIGSMGDRGRPAERTVLKSIHRSFAIPMSRCEQKADPTECKRQIRDKEASWAIAAGCRALKNMRSQKGIQRLAESEFGGRMAQPCLPAYLNTANSPEIKDQILSMLSVEQSQKTLKAYFREHPKNALGMAFHLMRRATPEVLSTCTLSVILGEPNGALMAALKNRLHVEEFTAFKELSDGLPASPLKSCTRGYLAGLGRPGVKPAIKGAPVPEVSTQDFFAVGDFCPK